MIWNRIFSFLDECEDLYAHEATLLKQLSRYGLKP
jgi:hypothetical protein